LNKDIIQTSNEILKVMIFLELNSKNFFKIQEDIEEIRKLTKDLKNNIANEDNKIKSILAYDCNLKKEISSANV